MTHEQRERLRSALDEVYAKYHHREFVSPDPLEVLYRYDTALDREIVGLIASALAFGGVRQILAGIDRILSAMESPRAFVTATRPVEMARAFRGFRHRFVTGEDMARLLTGVQAAIARYGSLQSCFLDGLDPEAGTTAEALCAFADRLRAPCGRNYLLADPRRGSACKRLHLYLRWLVRRDKVDPGGWDLVGPSRLIIPVDTHMHRLGRRLGLTRRSTADLRAALEITAAFRELDPDDPVRWDFALTRLGILKDPKREEILIQSRWGITPNVLALD